MIYRTSHETSRGGSRRLVRDRVSESSGQRIEDPARRRATRRWAQGVRRGDQPFEKAIDKWHENHLARYGLGGACAQPRRLARSLPTRFTNAVQVAPDQADVPDVVRHLALREGRLDRARGSGEAREQEARGGQARSSLSSTSRSRCSTSRRRRSSTTRCGARTTTSAASTARRTSRRKPRPSSRQAIAANPRESGPYIALGELYRRWDYTDQAIKVASAGHGQRARRERESRTSGTCSAWATTTSAHDKAIEAFTKAIESKRDNHKAKFQRGQAYFRKGDLTNAKRDLEEFSKSGGASLEFAKQQASEDADGHRREEHGARSKPPEEAVARGHGQEQEEGQEAQGDPSRDRTNGLDQGRARSCFGPRSSSNFAAVALDYIRPSAKPARSGRPARPIDRAARQRFSVDDRATGVGRDRELADWRDSPMVQCRSRPCLLGQGGVIQNPAFSAARCHKAPRYRDKKVRVTGVVVSSGFAGG